jgi:hypothetical protein
MNITQVVYAMLGGVGFAILAASLFRFAGRSGRDGFNLKVKPSPPPAGASTDPPERPGPVEDSLAPPQPGDPQGAGPSNEAIERQIQESVYKSHERSHARDTIR